jgi:hypothetical protein
MTIQSPDFEPEFPDQLDASVAPARIADVATEKKSARQRLLTLLVSISFLWVLFAWGVMPHVIGQAYEGHGIAFLERAMASKADYPLDHYLHKWNGIAASVLALWLIGLGLPLITTLRAFERRIIGTATPGMLGAMRAWVGVIAFYMACDSKLLDAPKLIAAGQKHVPMGVMDFFYRLGFNAVIRDPRWVLGLHGLTLVVLTMVIVGLFTRVSVALAVVLYLVVIGVNRSFFWLDHAGMIPWYCLLALAFTRCGDGFSIDRLIRRRRGKPVPDSDTPTPYYAWARWLVWTPIALCYAMAGLSKLGNTGGLWWEGTNLMALIHRNALVSSRSEFSALLTSGWIPHWAYTVVGIATIVTEVGMLAVLFSRLARRVLPAIAVCMHLGIIAVMNIHFIDLILIQAIFYDWRPVRRWIETRVGRAREKHKANASTAPEASDPPRCFALGMACGIIPALFALLWVTRTEFYPLTCFQMFTRGDDAYTDRSVVTFQQIYLVRRDGTRERVFPEHLGFASTRYWAQISAAFKFEKDRAFVEKWLADIGRRWNSKAPARSEEIARFELQEREWNFAEQASPTDAAVRDSIRIDVAMK